MKNRISIDNVVSRIFRFDEMKAFPAYHTCGKKNYLHYGVNSIRGYKIE